jgi:hypothetical protein
LQLQDYFPKQTTIVPLLLEHYKTQLASKELGNTKNEISDGINSVSDSVQTTGAAIHKSVSLYFIEGNLF